MTLLNQVINKKTISAPKGIIYGPPGVGKTSFGGSVQNGLVIDCENGAGAIVCKRTPYLSSWAEILSWLQTIERENHGFQGIAIDSLDWLLRRIEEHVSGCVDGKTDATLNKSHGGFGNGRQVFKNYVYQQLLPLLDRIVSRGVAVILLAHASRSDITDQDGITSEKTAPDLPDDFLGTFIEWSDFVCFARVEADGTRQLLTCETDRTVAKNRYSLPAAIPFDWNSFVNSIFNKKES